MANIVFGVMGDARGHVNRALVVAERMPEHRFLFVGGGRTVELERKGYAVKRVPMASTLYARNRVHVLPTALRGARVFMKYPRTLRRLLRVISDFDPVLALTDYEFFTPLAARRLGIPCVSVDHQHVITQCRCPAFTGQALSRMLMNLPLRAMYSRADRYLIPSFFPCPPRDPDRTEVFPPLISPMVKAFAPTEGSHVVVYQTSPTFRQLIPVLRRLSSRVIVYGLGTHPRSGNLVFRGPSKKAFLEDLSSCRYLITNGGHNAISEALYFGKPVLAFPIRLAYEQWINARMVSRLGYGWDSLEPDPEVSLFQRFETRLDSYREAIAKRDFYGTDRMLSRLAFMITRREYPCT